MIDYWVKFLGGETASQLKPLLKWVTEPGVGPGIASIIVIAGGLLLLFILITGIQDYLLISKARAILEKGTTQQTFSENYNTIDQELLELKKL